MIAQQPLLVCALPAEARSVGGRAAVRVLGPGRRAAQQLPTLLADLRPDCVVSWGVAGALRPELSVGDVVIPRWVCLSDGAALDCQPERIGLRGQGGSRLATADHAVTSPEQRLALRAATGADAVDMESAWLALVCREHGVPFCVVRAISDAASTRLPAWIGDVLADDGRVRTSMLVGSLVRDPMSMVSLLGMARGLSAACQQLRVVAGEAGFEQVRAA